VVYLAKDDRKTSVAVVNMTAYLWKFSWKFRLALKSCKALNASFLGKLGCAGILAAFHVPLVR
jgi:hypothetical protein